MRSRQLQRGHTLLEVLSALTLAMLVVGVAALALGTQGPEKRLRRSAAVVETTVRQLFWQSVQERRPRVLALGSEAISPKAGSWLALGNGARLEVRRFGEAEWRAPAKDERWTFSGAGLCEPLSLRVLVKGGSLEMDFDPLTGAVAAERSHVEDRS